MKNEEYDRTDLNNYKIKNIGSQKQKDICHGLVFKEGTSGLDVLLIKKQHNPNNAEKLWSHISGTRKIKDTNLESCIVRKILEETNITAKIIQKANPNSGQKGLRPDLMYKPEEDILYNIHTYYLIYESGKLKNNELHKHVDLAWFPVSHIPFDSYKDTNLRILDGKKYIELYLNMLKK